MIHRLTPFSLDPLSHSTKSIPLSSRKVLRLATNFRSFYQTMFGYFATQPTTERKLFDAFAPGVAYVSVEKPNGEQNIGTCFHVGEDVFVTARHVVEDVKIRTIATTDVGVRWSPQGATVTHPAGEASTIQGPYFHPDQKYDLAALRVKGIHAPQIPLFPCLEDPYDNRLLLKSVIVMGFPPIPGSKKPTLVCVRGEVSATFVNYLDSQQTYIVSTLARGGFSGGPAITEPNHSLGVITRSFGNDSIPTELGFMALVGPLPVLEMLDAHNMMPSYLKEQLWIPYCKSRELRR